MEAMGSESGKTKKTVKIDNCGEVATEATTVAAASPSSDKKRKLENAEESPAKKAKLE